MPRANVRLRPAPARTLGDDIMGALAALNRSIPGADETADGVQALTDLMSGRAPDAPSAWASARARSSAAAQSFAQAHRVGADLTKGAGLAIQAAPFLMTGGASAAPEAVAAGRAGMIGAAQRLAASSAKAAVIGGLSAQASGLAGEGTLRQRAQAANSATLPAMALGAALPPAGAVVGSGARALRSAIQLMRPQVGRAGAQGLGAVATAAEGPVEQSASGSLAKAPLRDAAGNIAVFYHGSPEADLHALVPKADASKWGFPNVVSLSTDPRFAASYAGQTGKVYKATVHTDQLGNFANPQHLAAAQDFWRRSAGDLDANDEAALAHGAWRLWENPDLWAENGWHGAWTREEPGRSDANTLNLSLASGDHAQFLPHNALGQPLVQLTGEELAPMDAPLGDLRDAAKAHYNALRGTTVPLGGPDGPPVGFNTLGRNKALSFSADPNKLRAFPALPEVIQRGVVTPEAPHKPVSPEVKAFHIVEAPVGIGDQIFPMRVVVRETKDGHFHYDHAMDQGEDWPPSTVMTPATKQGHASAGDQVLAPNMGAADSAVNVGPLDRIINLLAAAQGSAQAQRQP